MRDQNLKWTFGSLMIAKVLGKRGHIRPRKSLFTPVGNDCPFGLSEVRPGRKTLWQCRGENSWLEGNWQEGSPARRISSKSWVGAEQARIMAVQS